MDEKDMVIGDDIELVTDLDGLTDDDIWSQIEDDWDSPDNPLNPPMY